MVYPFIEQIGIDLVGCFVDKALTVQQVYNNPAFLEAQRQWRCRPQCRAGFPWVKMSVKRGLGDLQRLTGDRCPNVVSQLGRGVQEIMLSGAVPRISDTFLNIDFYMQIPNRILLTKLELLRRECIMERFSLWAAMAVVLGLFFAVQAPAATLHVEKWGEDSFTCGAASDPCQSISQAIYNATPNSTILVGPGIYGDLNGDGDLEDEGEENFFGNNNCGGTSAVVCINKPGLKVRSTLGAGATHITAQGGDYDEVVNISAGQVRFGKKKMGFTVEYGMKYGVRFRGRNIIIEGIVSTGNQMFGFYSNTGNANDTGNKLYYNRAVSNRFDGFFLSYGSTDFINHITQFTDNVAKDNKGSGIYIGNQKTITIKRNRVVGNVMYGIAINNVGKGTLVQDNLAQHNGATGMSLITSETGLQVRENMVFDNAGAGLEIFGPGKTILNNVSIGNRGVGFFLGGHQPAFRDKFIRNLAAMNGYAGVFLEYDGNTVSNFKFVQNNIYGNDSRGGANRGLVNNTHTTTELKNNFWGAASGPGPDPADEVVDLETGSVTYTNPSIKPKKIKVKPLCQ